MEDEATRAEDLTREHRELDLMLGRFLAAATAGDAPASRDAIAEFDDRLRRHTAEEEESVLPRPSGHRLAPAEDESDSTRLGRELRLEHVQIRELSGVLRRLAAEDGNLEGARRLFGNLARRWDAHTAKEEAALGGFLRERQSC